MTPAFLHRLQASSTKRVGLPDLKRLFFTLYPEVQNSPDREGQLLESLRALQAQGAIELPAAASWERVGAQALPKWVALVRERQVGVTEDYAQVPWVPEMGFWTKLKPAQLDSAKSINAFLLRRRTSLFWPRSKSGRWRYSTTRRSWMRCAQATPYSQANCSCR